MKNTILLTLICFFPFCCFSQDCPKSQKVGVHTIQKGETLYAVSRKYNISLQNLLSWNGISEKDVLKICQEIKVVNGAGALANLTKKGGIEPYQKQVGNLHLVQKGERIEKLAELYGYTLVRFRKMNELMPGEKIFVGMKLLSDDCICPTVTTSTKKSTVSLTEKGGQKSQEQKPKPINSGVQKFNSDNSKNNAGARNSSQRNSLVSSNTNFLKDEEKAMIEEINLVRRNPKAYIQYIEAYITELRSRSSYGTAIQSANELISELKSLSPLSSLSPTECLYSAAMKHGEDRRKVGSNDHVGSDGSWPWDRVRRECPEMTEGNENLVGGPDNVKSAVILLLVDDGISSRGHRKTLLNPKWEYVACYKIGKVGYMPNSWVQKFGF